MRSNSLALRLVLTSTAWLALALPGAGYLIFKLYSTDIQGSFDQRLEKLVNSIAVDALSSADVEPLVPPNRYEPLFEDVHSGWYWQIRSLEDPKKLLLTSPSLGGTSLPSLQEQNLSEDGSGQLWMNARGPVGEMIRIIEIKETQGQSAEGPRYAVSVAGPLMWVESRSTLFLHRLTLALALTGLGLVVAALVQVKVGLLPLRQIEKKLASIRSGDAQHLDGEVPSEIKALQTELNALIRSNQDIIDRARTQVGNLAHALKTPLAVILNEASQNKNVFGTKVSEQVLVMRDQITRYLERARIGARAAGASQATDVEAVVTPLLRALTRLHQEKGVKTTVTLTPGLRFKGEKQDLEEMIGNLLENAFKWASATVVLTAGLAPSQRGEDTKDTFHIVIEDDGPGIPEAERTKLGVRGVRLDETKPGSGLGLSIVTEVATLYRGTLKLDQSSVGGLRVCLTLPRVA